ncbi:hypothetical protein KLP28_12380 [Nocardioidaceae bacterium]|nr:hypothetical protein KLP28_12380 [Nocardioidaceae bacterium]
MRARIATAIATVGLVTSASGAYALSPLPTPYLQLRAEHNGARADVLVVKAPRYTAGGTIDLFRTASPGKLRWLMDTKTSNKHGDVRFRVKDRNGAEATEYRVVLRAAEGDYPRSVSNKRRVR